MHELSEVMKRNATIFMFYSVLNTIKSNFKRILSNFNFSL